MAELICKNDGSEQETISNSGTLLERRIEFHHARKPLNSIYNGDLHLETLNPISDSQNVSAKMSASTIMRQKLDGSHIYELGLDPEFSLKIRFQRIGAGLANLGNTCFLNSVLQCLTYTEPLAAYLQSGKHKSSCYVAGFCAMCAIQNHVMNALQSSGKILSPFHLVKNLRCISRNFRNSRQEDAHEYMVNLMESMHKCCLPYGVPSESPIAYEKSLVHKIFGGRLRSQVKCKQCSHASNTYDPFLDLSLEIRNAVTLHKALVNFTAMEHLDGGEKIYRCEHCKEKVVALKQLTIHKAPYVLTIHLKRFGSGLGEKIVKNVRFAASLDLKPYVSGPYKGELKYTLYGVLVHAGWNTHSGHYYSFVRTSSGAWHVLDDNKVSPVSEKVVMEQKAYMLFYVVNGRNSNPKKLVEVGREIKNVSRVVEIKKTPIDPLRVKETIRDDKVERKLSTVAVVEASSKDFISKEPSVLQSGGQVIGEAYQGSAGTVENVTSSATCQPFDAIIGRENRNQLQREVPTRKHSMENGVPCQVHDIKNVKCLTRPLSKGIEESDLQAENNGSVDIPKKSTVGERVLKLEKSVSMELSNQHSAANGCAFDTLDKHADHAIFDKSRGRKIIDKNDGGKVLNKHDREVVGKCNFCQKRQVMPIKLGMCHMPIGRKRLFSMALRLQKKSKRRRDKRFRLDLRNFSHKGSLESIISSEEEASTSKVTNSKLNDRISVNTKKHDIAERYERNDTVLATDATENGLLKDNYGGREQAKQRERGSIQNCLMGLLTRGVEEASVARWEGIEMETSDINSSMDTQPRSIGYLLDEWDEEYDQGKRKKIRRTEDFSIGYNPFQEYAMKQSHSKKTKIDRTRYENQPSRIKQ